VCPDELRSQDGNSASEMDRELWFDFLAKLNDRSLQEKRESGATAWVLLAAAVAIVYKAVPLIPHFLAVPGATNAAWTMFLLGIDAGLLTMLAFSGVVIYVTGGPEKRLIPDIAKRVRRVITAGLWAMMMALGGLHVWWWMRFNGQPLVKRVLMAFGIFWFLNAVAGMVKKYYKAAGARQKRTTLPEFYGFELGYGRGALWFGALNLIVGIPASCALFVFVKGLSRAGADWVTPLGAAGYCVAFIAVVYVLYLRVISSGHRGALLALERAIVVEDLPVNEIRRRFEAQLLGTAVADWLKGIEEGVSREYASLKSELSGVVERAKSVEAVDPLYPLERRGRAEKLIKEHKAALSGHFSNLKGHMFQLREVLNIPGSPEEQEILTRIMSDCEKMLSEVEVESSAAIAAIERMMGATHATEPAVEKE
jgi:hypothetical protein